MAERWVTREDGVLQCVDDTGNVLAVQKVNPAHRKKIKPAKARPDHHYIQDSRGRTLWVPIGTDPATIGNRKIEYPFCPVTWALALELVASGKSLAHVAEQEGFPPISVLYRWKNQVEERQAEYEAAKEASGDHHYDQAVAIAENGMIGPDDAAGERVRADIHKWAAGVDNPRIYGKQTKITGDAGHPIVIQVSTGVPEPKALTPRQPQAASPSLEQKPIPPVPVDFTSGGAG